MATSDDFTGPVNIGNPNEFTIMELAEKVLKLTGSPSKLIFKPLPSDDPQQRRPDISLATDTLDWVPAIQLEEGLKRTIGYFRDIGRVSQLAVPKGNGRRRVKVLDPLSGLGA
jgi:UDP-glucuronate decarboxylase